MPITVFNVKGVPSNRRERTDDPNWLFNANQFGPAMSKALREKFNKSGEKPLTTIITKPDDK